MPASPKRSMKRLQRPLHPDPWSGWIDAAVGIGQAVVAYELMFVAALAQAPAIHRSSSRRARLVLVYSCATAAAPAQPGTRPVLRSVPRRDEGKT